MPYDAALYLGLHCLSKYTFRSRWYTQGEINNLLSALNSKIYDQHLLHFVQSVVFTSYIKYIAVDSSDTVSNSPLLGVQSYIAEYLKIEKTDQSEISGIVGS